MKTWQLSVYFNNARVCNNYCARSANITVSNCWVL